MNKNKIEVPAGIRYISEWKEFKLPEYPHILDKQITGCGFTQWAITCSMNVILVSPRLMLLENKEKQHKDQVYYAKNDLERILEVDKNLETDPKKGYEEKEKEDIDAAEKIKIYKKNVQAYVRHCFINRTPCKLLVTYDSYRLIYETLIEIGVFESFYTIVDEFQSIFTDSRFKSSTEMEFVEYLQRVNKLCFVSATPYLDEYLDMLDEFKDLPYYELDWETLDPGRIIKPQLSVHPCQRIIETALKIIQTYQNGEFEKTVIRSKIDGRLCEIESKELVIYVNSVKNICDIIKKAGLTLENTNVLCSRTSENQKKIRKAFGLGRADLGGIGEVPGKDEPRKMFTLCTRTVYLGADFYSDNARSIILSDANIECLAVDITLDLPQILGRQRLNENPWKNRAELYVKILSEKNKITVEDFINYLTGKKNKTMDLLSIYKKGTSSEKHNLAETYQKVAKTFNYRDDYVSVNTHGGKDMIPTFNKLVMVAELRAFQVQQIDYVDRFRVANQINSSSKYDIDPATEEVNNFLLQFENFTQFPDKMKLLCEFGLSERALDIVLSQIPIEYKTFYVSLGPDRIKANCYKKGELNKELKRQLESTTGGIIGQVILSNFNVGDRISVSDIKQKLKNLYLINNIKSSPKAVELFNYFEIKKTKVKSLDGSKFVDGYEILNIKSL